MNYTPYGTLTDNEVIREVCNKSDPTDLELELMERLTYWMEYAETLMGDADKCLHSAPDNKYAEAA